jgi:predicted patatin/cPLA2 family phospholipase
MFRLSNIVSNIEIARRNDIHIANTNTISKPITSDNQLALETLKDELKAEKSKYNTAVKEIEHLRKTSKLEQEKSRVDTKSKMIDKSTMTEIQTSSVGCDTKELESINAELKALEIFKKQQEERITQASLMSAYLGTSRQEIHEDFEDE